MREEKHLPTMKYTWIPKLDKRGIADDAEIALKAITGNLGVDNGYFTNTIKKLRDHYKLTNSLRIKSANISLLNTSGRVHKNYK